MEFYSLPKLFAAIIAHPEGLKLLIKITAYLLVMILSIMYQKPINTATAVTAQHTVIQNIRFLDEHQIVFITYRIACYGHSIFTKKWPQIFFTPRQQMLTVRWSFAFFSSTAMSTMLVVIRLTFITNFVCNWFRNDCNIIIIS